MNEMNLSNDLFHANIATKATRSGFGDALVELAKKNTNIVVLTADLKESVKVADFAKNFPNRFIDVGVAEQNMAGIAAGLALSGKIPVMTSYATFSPGRNLDQIRASICYTNANVKIVSSNAGLSAVGDGATHQALEDIAITRTLPNITVLIPADYEQAKRAIEAAIKIKGPVYIRIMKSDTPVFTTPETPFKVGAAQVLKEGTQISIIASGTQVYEALLAAKELELKHKIDAEIINCHTIKPLDENTIVKSAQKTKLVITVEEHQVAGGLGGAVAELLGEQFPTWVHKIGIQDTFGESGIYEDLLEKYGLTSKYIVNKVLEVI